MFITFEGGEGSGKTYQSKELVRALESLKIPCLWTREIGGTKAAEKFREIILHEEIDSLTELLAIMAARNEHIQKIIKPAIKEGIFVICDRFIDSTVAYQQNKNLKKELILELHKNLLDNFIPSITFLLSLNPEEALKRALLRGDNNKFESKDIDFHIKVHNNFLSLANDFPSRIKLIDCNNKTKEVIHKEIFLHLKDQLPKL